jgi:anti-sigma B factor antagonist
MVSGGALVIEVDGTADVPRLRFTGELDLAGVDAARAALDAGVSESAERVELELAELAFLDSSGLSVFIELARRVPVTIVSSSGPVRRIITVTGLDETLGLAP